LPEHWAKDAARCAKAGVPEEARVYRSKTGIAQGMIRRARRHGLSFDGVAADGGDGKETWFLEALDDDGERFLVDVHADPMIYLTDPAPDVPERRGRRGRVPMRPVTEARPLRVDAWASAQPATAWRRMRLRDGEKGEVAAEFLTCRVFVWNGKDERARSWHLLCAGRSAVRR
jgi:SRSO17 transposase